MRKPKSDGQKPSEGKPIKRTYKNVVKEDPAAPSVSAKRHKTSDKPTDYKKKSSSGAPAVSGKASKPHADAVEKSNRLWERLRNERTPVEEREALVGEVFTLFHGNLLSVLQKHDTARVLQSCFKLGTPAQRDAQLAQARAPDRRSVRPAPPCRIVWSGVALGDCTSRDVDLGPLGWWERPDVREFVRA